jgi:hypothetical protein
VIGDEQLELVQLLHDVDVDGALQETASAAFPATRLHFLRAFALGVAGAASAAAARPARAAGGLSAGDVAILRFDLVLEYLQAGLYTEAERLGVLNQKTLGWARVVGAHERAHAQAIKGILGPKAVPSPVFNYRGITVKENPFVKTAVAFEELTAALLKWQAVRLDSREVVAAVATLHSVETRHAAWIRRIVGLQPARSAFDQPAAQRRMARLIASTHFVAARPRTSGSTKPPYTG